MTTQIPARVETTQYTAEAVLSSSAPSRSTAVEKRVAVASLIALAVGAFGLFARDLVIGSGISAPIVQSNNIFFRLYALHEQPFLWLVVLTGAAALFGAYRPTALSPALARVVGGLTRVPPAGVAAAVLGLAAVGTVLVMHGVGLSMDEYGASFQARIFASGQVQAVVPDEWRPLAPWMTPVFVNYKPAAGLWVSSYLPVYAAIRAAFSIVSAEWLTNAVLAAASVILLAAVSRRLWIGERRSRAGGLALIFLAVSPQFLVTSMSGYSMPAHLCLNLLWLWLYLRGDRRSMLAMPVVGVLALGLHNPVPHALFAAPFLFRLLRDRRLGWAAYCAVVYLAGIAACYAWLSFVHSGLGSPGGTPSVVGGYLTNFSFPNLFAWFVQGMSLALFLTWQTPVVAILLPVAVMGWRKLEPVERDLALGLTIAWAFYALVSANQGHGWGYRYLYPVLPNAVLLAARGADAVWRAGRDALVARLVVASIAVTLLVQWPMRAIQVESFVRPYAAAFERVSRERGAIVAIDPSSAWYGRDLIRNDPLFEGGPRVIALAPIGGRLPDASLLPDAARGSVKVMSPEELASLGLPTFKQTRR